MLCRVKEEILNDFAAAVMNQNENTKRRLELEVQVDIRDRLETLYALQRKRLTIEEKRLEESRGRNREIANLTKTIDGLPPSDVEVEVEATT